MQLSEYKKEQLGMAKKVVVSKLEKKPEIIAGIDKAFISDKIVVGVVACDKNFKEVDSAFSVKKLEFPYVAGYLGYREGPAMLEAFSLLKNKPDLLIVEGNGILHPRKFGLACYVGLGADVPTIGIAKSLLAGEVKEGKVVMDDEVIGKEFLSKKGAKPLYISIGNKITLGEAVKIVEKSIVPPHKLPEPLHLAHRFAKKTANKFKMNK